MIHFVEINGTKYPFKYGMRELWTLSQNSKVEGNVDTDSPADVLQKVSMDFDAFLEFHHLASVKGSRLHEKESGEKVDPISKVDLEDAIDEDFELMEKLNDVVEQSQGKAEKKAKPKAKS